VFCVLVNQLTLLAVHAVERFDPALLLRLLGQLYELGKLVVNHDAKLGVLLGELLHEFGVAWCYL